jgi:hypothetical protein
MYRRVREVNLQCTQCEKEIENNSLREAKLKFPCEDDGQDIKNDVVHDHDDRVRVEEGLDVDTSSGGVFVPEVCDWHALEDHDQNAADAKGESNEFHEPDYPVMPTLICCVAIEEEKSELDEHIAGQVKDEDRDVQLTP